ncbi:MAG: hypothetical protein LUO86_05745 [Methanomicrobiales archaeon]|nr:hypothetical protein [Methanomicrobiales archaeon]
MRSGIKLVLTIIAAFILHWVFYFSLAEPGASGNTLFDPLLGSLFLNLVGIPIGIVLGKTRAHTTDASHLGFRSLFTTVLFFWVFIFGFLTAPGLLVGTYVTDAIRESGDIPPARSRSRLSFSISPVSSLRLNR